MTIQLAPGLTLPPRALPRHIGIFGATGTGKTSTAATLVTRAPCPVIALDAKGDLEGLGRVVPPRMRVDALGLDLLTRALDLSEAQAGVLSIALAWAEDTSRPVADLSDLRSLLADTAATPLPYGLVTPSSVAAVMRAMLRLERGAPWLFGTGAPDWRKLQGVTVVPCKHVAELPGAYGAFAVHVLDSLYRGLGEYGQDAAGLMVMIDEAHLMFDGATAGVVRRLEQITRLIRSKGVGLIYVTQSPADLPDAILGQLGTRVQHGLRAATPRQVAALRAAAETLPGGVRPDEVAALGVGQAWVAPFGAAKAMRVQLDYTPVEAPATTWQPPEGILRPPVAQVAEDEPATVAHWRESWWWRMLAPVLILWGLWAASLVAG